MCGRYSLHNLPEHLKATFEIHGRLPNIQPRYNIAPTQTAPVIGVNPDSGERSMVEMRWGLIPHWAKDESIGNKMFNARSETLLEKPAFRGEVKRHRCIIPASGFYEWKKIGKERQPYYFTRRDGEPMGVAGLYASWGDGAEKLYSFTIITAPANAALEDIHERMPVILTKNDLNAWLDPSVSPEVAREALVPIEAEDIKSWQVGRAVNTGQIESPDLIRDVPLNSL